MKVKFKTVFTILLFFIALNSISAQISIGIQGGLNSAILKLSNKAPIATLNYKNGFIIGTIINYKLNRMFSIQSEPRYIQKGERVKIDYFFFKTDSKIYFDYIEIPIYFVTEFSGTQFRPFALGGINIGYLINAKAESIISGKKITFDIKGDYKKLDIAVDLGIGLKYKISSVTSLLLSARYSYGIYDFSKRDGSVNTRGIQMLFGILYKL